MTKFYEKLNENDRQKYIKELEKNIDCNIYNKILEFMKSEDLYITNVKASPIKIDKSDSMLIIDNSKNKWFIFSIDGKINLIAKKNILIHTDKFIYDKREISFTKKQNIKFADYFVEYVENVGANLTLNLNNYYGNIGKSKWNFEIEEIGSMSLEYTNKKIYTGYTYNCPTFSFCNIGKDTQKQIDVLK